VVFVSGEAGSGKTALVEKCLQQSERLVLRGRGREKSGEPFAVFRTAVRPLGDTAEVLGESFYDPAQVADSILTLMPDETSTAFLLDDLHWADSATLEVIPWLAERCEKSGIVLFVLYRSESVGRRHPLRRLRSEVRRHAQSSLSEFHLGALAAPDALQMVAQILGGPISKGLAAKLLESTQCLPMYLEELSRALLMNGALRKVGNELELARGEQLPLPESIQDAVLSQLQRLSDPARAGLESLAVAGLESNLAVVLELLSEEDLDELIERGFLVLDRAENVRFRRHLVREALLSELSFSRRTKLHLEVARALTSHDGAEEEIAEHLVDGRESVRAREWFLKAAQDYRAVHAYRDAMRVLQKALENWGTENLQSEEHLLALEHFGRCAQSSGELGFATQAYKDLIELCHHDARRASALESLATVHRLNGKDEEAVEAHRQCLEAYCRAGDCERACSLSMIQAEILLIPGLFEEARTSAEQALVFAKRADDRSLVARSMGLLAYVQASVDCESEALELSEHALRLAIEQGRPDLIAEAQRRKAGVLEYASQYGEACDAYDQTVNYCRTEHVEGEAELCVACMAWVYFRSGNWTRTQELCQSLTESRGEMDLGRCAACAMLGLVMASKGEARSARELLQKSQIVASNSRFWFGLFAGYWGDALLAQATGNDEEASHKYQLLLQAWRSTQDRHDALPAAVSALSFLSRTGRESELAAWTEYLSTIASRSANKEALGVLSFSLAVDKKGSQRVEHCQRALGHFQACEATVEAIYARWHLGLAHLANEQLDDARSDLLLAKKAAKRLGARPLGDMIAESLGPLDEEMTDHAPGLTPRQSEVGRLVASGLTNREIAEQLCLSQRTIDMHVRHILERLDCRSRTEAAVKLAESGIV
jgi:DNA-binding CsgD family transcriptional regulator/tetratricopeptide (TPR) repeat protein